ncbi:MAG TPA: chemotaxis-specific protein-glutamate methyltransferase CheB [Candidatus Omnitrophota bacterium]|nr:chemotaxis-specific protein-glutamate methyltransferase CheB [Candidatus Omnitrophota bacterium]HPS36657.1 chemotaxis-specific protein-glutamate methyltransferase CheB [Candidatus Omnitrophota bacterium]
MANKIRVLVVDDSALVRQSLKAILNEDLDVEVVGEARNGKEGFEKALTLKPDVITMDLTMPVMDGLESTAKIMEDCPTPIIIVSSMDVKVIVKALALGAMDFVAVTQEIGEISEDLVEKVKIASRVRPIRRMKFNHVSKKIPVAKGAAAKVVAVGVSTGGPQALQILLSSLPAGLPASILVVQHISPGFIQGLADWLNLTSSLHVEVAKTGDVLRSGVVLLAPDNFHMTVDDQERIVLKEDVSEKKLHVPSIDVLFESVADAYQKNAVGVILTGMGRDGVKGISIIKGASGHTIAQDEKTSAIFGMNKIAIDEGVIDAVLPLEKIADEIVRLVNG